MKRQRTTATQIRLTKEDRRRIALAIRYGRASTMVGALREGLVALERELPYTGWREKFPLPPFPGDLKPPMPL